MAAHTLPGLETTMERHNKKITYSKVNNYIDHRQYSKATRFDIPVNAERAPNIYEDLYELAQNGFRSYEPVQSEVWCERFDEKHPLNIFTNMRKEYFFEFLSSCSWENYSSLRVTSGPLLDELLTMLTLLEANGKVRKHETVYYDHVVRERPRTCLKGESKKIATKQETETRRISFSYYFRLRNARSKTRESASSRFTSFCSPSPTSGYQCPSFLSSSLNSLASVDLNLKDESLYSSLTSLMNTANVRTTDIDSDARATFGDATAEKEERNAISFGGNDGGSKCTEKSEKTAEFEDKVESVSEVEDLRLDLQDLESPSKSTMTSREEDEENSLDLVPSLNELPKRKLSDEKMATSSRMTSTSTSANSTARDPNEQKKRRTPVQAEKRFMGPVYMLYKSNQQTGQGIMLTPRDEEMMWLNRWRYETDALQYKVPIFKIQEDWRKYNYNSSKSPDDHEYWYEKFNPQVPVRKRLLARKLKPPQSKKSVDLGRYSPCYSDKLECDHLGNEEKEVRFGEEKDAEDIRIRLKMMLGSRDAASVGRNRGQPKPIDQERLNTKYSYEYLLPERVYEMKRRSAKLHREKFVEKWEQTLTKYDMYSQDTGRVKRRAFKPDHNKSKVTMHLTRAEDKVVNTKGEVDNLSVYFMMKPDQELSAESFRRPRDTFRKDLLNAMEKFVVRKETVVVSKELRTITTVTINRAGERSQMCRNIVDGRYTMSSAVSLNMV